VFVAGTYMPSCQVGNSMNLSILGLSSVLKKETYSMSCLIRNVFSSELSGGQDMVYQSRTRRHGGKNMLSS